jgi:integrase/recombinase XerD
LKRLLDAPEVDGPGSALITLLAYHGLRVDDALSRDIEHLGNQLGHRAADLTQVGRDPLEPLSAPPNAAVDRYLVDRTGNAVRR